MVLKSLKNKFLLEITVFICGGLVMIYEIIGSRILAPYIGTSTYTWTSLIGVILAALSLGYWLGGKWADKKPELKILSFVIFLAGGLVSITIFLKDFILPFVAQNSLPLELKSMLAAILLFAPASVFLGFVTPYAVKLKTTTLDKTGETVGRLYALSTIGSIIGTFSAGFLLIPFVGSTRTLYFIAGSLFLLSILLVPFSISRLKIGLLAIFILGIILNESFIHYQQTIHNFHDIDTEYSRIQILDTKHKKNGRPIRVIKFDPYTYQSSMYLDTGKPADEYTKFYHLIRHFNPDFKKVLMIGGAGYSFPKEFLKTYPNAEIEVVEIDPQMTELAKKHFNLKPNPRLKIHHQDGRVFLNQAKSNQYDAILIDAFNSLFNIPFQLTTIEAIREIDRVLKNDGVVIVNVGGAIEGKGSRFLQAEIKTYQKIFPIFYLYKVNLEKNNTETQNIIFVAIKTEKNYNIPKTFLEITNFEQQKTQILSDDFAPVEYFSSSAYNTQ